jgi:hypothetical protein
MISVTLHGPFPFDANLKLLTQFAVSTRLSAPNSVSPWSLSKRTTGASLTISLPVSFSMITASPSAYRAHTHPLKMGTLNAFFAL